jgi:mRNA interferase RelE/StbE
LAWTIEFDSGVEKDLKKLGRNAQKFILDYLENRISTAEDPRVFGKPMRHELAGCWRYRVGNYRIIAKIEDDRLVVLVVKIGHRKDVYD